MTVVPLWPTNCDICSTGTPASDNTETNECRNSRGVHSNGSRLGTRGYGPPEVPSNIGGVHLGTERGCEHKPCVLPPLTGRQPIGGLLRPLLSEGFTHRAGTARVRRDFFVLVSPPSRTERQTSMCGGTGPSVSGCPR